MKKVILFSVLIGLTACSHGGGGGSGSSPFTLTGAQKNQTQKGFVANDPNTPRVSLDQAVYAKWSTDCQKSNVQGAAFMGAVTEIHESGAIYESHGYFADKDCTVGLAESGLRKKLGTFQLLDLADSQPSGDMHIKSSTSFDQTAQGEFRESMLHISLSGANAQTMQITTTDLMVKNGTTTVEDTQIRGKTKIAHRTQGI